jgi:hypothetical protein
MFHDLDRIEGKVFWIEIFDRMTGFSGDYRMGRRSLDRIYRIYRIGFWGFSSLFSVSSVVNIDRAVFWQRGGLFVWFVCIS